MSTLRVAAVQLLSDADPAANLRQVEERTVEAAAQGARLVVFPEATMRRFGRSLTEVAEPADGPWAAALAGIAERSGVVVAAGMFTPSSDGRVRNTLRVVGPGVDAAYDKIHLYDAFGFRESDTVAPGEQPLVVDVDGVGVGFGVCYDLRFPGLFTTLADNGAQVICVPASWGAGPGKVDQWRLLLRARALDATTWVIGAGQADPVSVGRAPEGSTPLGVGHSGAVSPTGALVAELGPAPGVLLVDVETDAVDAARRAIPVLANRRL